MLRPMIVVYDADCGVCQASVAWVKERDRRGVFEFVGNDSAPPPGGSREETEHTMILLDGGRQLVRAQGVARNLSELPGGGALGALPRAPRGRHPPRLGDEKVSHEP